MITPLQSAMIEFKKTKRKPTFLLIVIVCLINLCYLFIGMKKNSMADFEQAWEAVFFYLPLLNSLFLSVLVAVLASRTMDLEHKSGIWNLLQTLQSKRSIYLGKVIYGFIWIVIYALFQMVTTISFSKYMGFRGLPSTRLVLLTILGEIVGAMIIYQLQMIFSLIFSSQFAALSISLCGTLGGFFLMYVSDRILLPWSMIGALRVLNMDYNKGDEFSTYTEYLAPFSFWVVAIMYIAVTLIAGLYLYFRMEENHLPGIHTNLREGKLHTFLPPELIKLKRSPVWIVFFVMPLISGLIGIFNFVANQDALDYAWADLWTQQSLFLGIFFLSPLIAILASLMWRMEHNGTNWNIALTIEKPEKLIRDKYLVICGVSILCILWIGTIFIISGKILKLPGSVPMDFYECMICGCCGCLAVASIQAYLSLRIRSFAIPVGIALAGGLAGIALIAKGYGFFLPYGLITMGLKSTNLTTALNIPLFIFISILYAAFFYVLSLHHIKHTDA